MQAPPSHAVQLQGSRPHIFGMTASPVNTKAKQTQAKVAEAVWQLERNMDAQVITVIDRNPVIAAAPLPEMKLLYYSREHDSEALKDAQGGSEGKLQKSCLKIAFQQSCSVYYNSSST